MNLDRFLQLFARPLLAWVLALSICPALVAVDATRKTYDLPAADAVVALKRFSEQSGRELVYPVEQVRGITTQEVKGELTALEAINRMLAGTDLYVLQDEKTGALAVNRATDPNAARAAQGSGRPQKSTTTKGGALELERVEVSSSKINGPVNQTIFSTTETGVFNYDVISRVDIDRMGVTSLEELMRFVPQTSDYGSVSLQGQVGNPQIAGGATFQNSEVKLRGFASTQTAILINGRRLQRGNITAGADLSRIPIGAIERIEILPSSASAVYGGGAIGGVINVILRKDFAGRDLTATFSTSTDGGGTKYGFSFYEGRFFNEGRTRLSLTLAYEKTEPLYLDDRDFLQRALNRYPQSSALTVSGRPIFEQYIIPAFAAAPGTIVINAVTGGLGIPGNPNARFAGIPTGLTSAQANALTPDSFSSTADRANLSPRYGRSIVYRPEERSSINGSFEHDFIPDKLSFYSEFGGSYFRSQYSFPQITTTVNLTATDPLNPFRTGVTPGFVGKAITIYLDAKDLPDSTLFQERQGARTVLGFKGKIGDNWEWSLDGTGEYGRSHSDGMNPTQNLVTFMTSTATVGLTQAQRRAIYNPLADHSANPASAAMAPYYGYNRQFSYYNYLAQANFRVVGDVFDLPAGPIRVSPGAEFIWFQARSGQVVTTAPDYLAALGGVQGVPSVTRNSRRTESAFVESSIPLISEKWRPLPLHAVELNLAARWEGTDDSTDKTSPTAGIRVALTRDVAFRVAYSEGFFPPDQSNYEAPRSNPAATTPFNDPARGNLSYNYPRGDISGGNPNLKPETSTAWNYGVILTPRFLRGLTFTADYWTIEKKDAIRVIPGPFEVVANPTSYPGRLERSAPSASDLAAGWLGPVTLIDWTPINVGFTKTEGADFRLRYLHDAGETGQFTFVTTASWTNSFRDQVLVVNPIVERVNSSGNPLKWRGNASLFWERQAWTAGLTARYVDAYSADSTVPSPAFPTATGFDGAKIGSATLFDLQFSYKIPYSQASGRGVRDWVSGTQWTLGIENVLNKEPEFRTDRFGFYSRYENPRQRYVSFSIKKSL
jgi:iron complex outermembrane receptor protein